MRNYGIALACVLFPLTCFLLGLYGSFLFCFPLPVLWNVGIRKQPFSSLGFRRQPVPETIAWGAGSGVVLGLAGGWILKAFGITGYSLSAPQPIDINIGPLRYVLQIQHEIGARTLFMSTTPAGMLVYVFFMLAVIGLGEELFWRGFIQQKIKKFLPVRLSVIACALLFSLAHVYLFVILPAQEGTIFLLIIFLAGLTWGYLFERTGALWAPAISHGLTALIIWKYFFFTR